MNNQKRLIINLVILTVVGTLGYFAYTWISGSADEELKIQETENNIQSIRTIAEISTVNYRDEVVIDSVEYYDTPANIYNPLDWYRKYNRDVKRRLTLIIKGDIRYGLDVADENFSVESTEDSLKIVLPEPTLLDVILSPNRTEVYKEEGTWNDNERKQMEMKGKKKLISNAEKFKLKEKARENALELLNSMIKTNKKISIRFE